MAVTNTEAESSAALYDTSTGIAFGPVFECGADCDDFLVYVKEGAEQGKRFYLGDLELLFVDNIRSYRDRELQVLKECWERDRDAEG